MLAMGIAHRYTPCIAHRYTPRTAHRYNPAHQRLNAPNNLSA